LTFPGEYDNTIPNITLAEYIIGKIEEFGDEEACVRILSSAYIIIC